MKKNVILILTIVLCAFLMLGSVSAASIFDLIGNESNTENDGNTFIVGFNSEFPPFGYKDDNGNYAGFDLELAKEVCKRNNWTFTPQPIIDWNSKELEINSNEVDCIWSEFTINGREDDYTWSEAYLNSSPVIVVKKDSNINSPSDLKGKTVEVQEGSSALKTLDENNKTLKDSFKELTEIREYNTGFMDLESGVCDALIGDIGTVKYHMAQDPSGNYKILDEPLSHEYYGVAFKKGNEELRDQVQKTLDEMFEDGTVDRIAQNYSDYGIPENLIYPENSRR